MSSIIVVDSSDEEADGTHKRTNSAVPVAVSSLPATRMNQQPAAPLARVNSKTNLKKSQALPNDNFKIHLPIKRTINMTTGSTTLTSNNNITTTAATMPTSVKAMAEQVPEKRIKRVKPTTLMHSNEDEWRRRQIMSSAIQRNGGEQVRVNPTAISKNAVNPMKALMKVVKNQNPITNAIHGPTQAVINPAPGNASKNYVRFVRNGKDQSMDVTIKEQPKLSTLIRNPANVVKNSTTTKGLPLPSTIYNKREVTIRRVVVNEERPKIDQSLARPPNNNIVMKLDQLKTSTLNVNPSTSVRRIPLTTEVQKTSSPVPVSTPNRNANNNTTSIKLTQVSSMSTSAVSIRNSTSNVEAIKTPQSLTVVKPNVNISRIPQSSDSSMVVTPTQPMTTPTPATIRKILTVDLPPSPSVIAKTNLAVKKPANDMTIKSSMSVSMVTKNNVNPPTTSASGLPSLLTRPSGLIVTPVTNPSVVSTSTVTPSKPSPSEKPRATSRAPLKAAKTSNRGRPPTISTDQSMATISPYSMFPPSGAFMGGPPMIYDVDPSGGAFINPAFIPNRPMRSMENTTYPTMASPVFNMNFPSFSGGSITPVTNTGTTPTTAVTVSNSGRSSKSPITCTVTKSSNPTRTPANHHLMSIPIDVEQPMAPMSPPVYNMNHPALNGDPLGFLQNSHLIPSPAYSPVRSTCSPAASKPNDTLQTPISLSSTLFPRDLESFVRNPQSYSRSANTSSTFTGNGPIVSVDNRIKNHQFTESPNTKASPMHSTVSDGYSLSESLINLFSVGDEKSKSEKPDKEQSPESSQENTPEPSIEEHEKGEKEPLNTEYETLLQACREADSSDDMNKLIDKKLIRYYYSVHPDFVKSRGFRKAVVSATENIRKNPDLVYYHLRPVVEEMKARKNSKAIVMTNDETPASSATILNEQEQKAEKTRNKQIKILNKTLYILTRKIHKLENEDVDLNDENSSYLIVERYKKRACDIYNKICALTGESKHALRQVKKPITFKGTSYPTFNRILEAYVNRTKEFPDFCDVLRMLEFCNKRYHLGLIKEEMTMIAEDAFIKVGKLLQSRRKADLYETVSHFTSDCDDPAANDPTLLAKLAENEKKRTSIGSIIDKYARVQVQKKVQSGDEGNQTSDATTDDEEDDDEQPSTSTAAEKSQSTEQQETTKNPIGATTNGIHSPHSSDVVSSASPSPSATASTSATTVAFRTSPPHAFISPHASPSQRLSSISPPPLLTLPPPPPPPAPSSTTSEPWTTTNSLKILSVTSLNIAATQDQQTTLPVLAPSGSIDEIVISDEDL